MTTHRAPGSLGTDLALGSMDPADVSAEYERRRFHLVSDDDLVAAVARVVARPKVAPADSFVLHAPLELLARTLLLPRVHGAARREARVRLVELAASYAAAGDEVPGPDVGDLAERSAADLAAALAAALAAGELDDVDRLAAALGAVATPAQLGELLGDDVVASLAAAAHASILFSLLPRAARLAIVPVSILRGPARSLARQPTWRLRWFEHPDEPAVTSSLADALGDVPVLGLPGSTFIFPIMDQAERSGVAPRSLSGVAGLRPGVRPDLAQVSRDVSRVAARSMLQEPTDHARYGWTHCLTMPQAVLALAGRGADPRRAAAVAATHVVGFRAALGRRTLDPGWVPSPSGVATFDEALSAGPTEAAAWAWHSGPEHRANLEADLATEASTHHDAHLVKYTLASLDAARADPDAGPLHLAAAAHLASVWRTSSGDASG